MASTTRECFGKAASTASGAEGERHRQNHCVKADVGARVPESTAKGSYVRENLQLERSLNKHPDYSGPKDHASDCSSPKVKFC